MSSSKNTFVQLFVFVINEYLVFHLAISDFTGRLCNLLVQIASSRNGPSSVYIIEIGFYLMETI